MSKGKGNEDIECSSVYFNSMTETVINFEFSFDETFQEISSRIDNWINEGSGWITKYVNKWWICEYFYVQSIDLKFFC